MPAIIQYLLKLSVSAAVIYTFYYLVLRRLTFYNLNRWYLTGYTFLCFIIPFINITQLANKADEKMPALNYIPVVQNINNYMPPALNDGEHHSFAIWDAILPMLAIGSVILLGKLAVQMYSFMRLRQNAKLISDKDSAIYHVEGQVMPFSFGRSIYLNKNMHTDRELGEIIMHEYVHVKQLHSADILLAELFCVINWFNPFAWFIRHSIRQNLEFIADDNVVRSGINKKDYQYHLLKVVGIPQYRLANQFNFSSLKKRIIMMNRAKSAKIHLLKFLFILPLLAVTLMAFRSDIIKSVDKITSIPVMSATSAPTLAIAPSVPSITIMPVKTNKALKKGNGLTTVTFKTDTNFKETMNVPAYFDGTVLKTMEISDTYLVILRNGDRFDTYSNLKSINVKKGDQVKKGQEIGVVDVDSITGIPKLKFSIYNGTALVLDEDGTDTGHNKSLQYITRAGTNTTTVYALKSSKGEGNSWSTGPSSYSTPVTVTPVPGYAVGQGTQVYTSTPATTMTGTANYSYATPATVTFTTAKPVTDSVRISYGRSYPSQNVRYVLRDNTDLLVYTIDPKHINEADFSRMEKQFASNGLKLKIKDDQKSSNNRLRIEVSGAKENNSSSASANFSADDLASKNSYIRITGDKKTGAVSISTYSVGRY